MQISPLLQSILQLAGHMMSYRCVALAKGRTSGTDLGRFMEGRAPQVTLGDPRSHVEAAQYRALMASPPWDDAMALVLQEPRTLQMEGTPFTDALVVEFADVAGQLNGLAIGLPFQPRQGTQAFVTHSVRLLACPPALRPLADDIVIAFARGMKSHEQGNAAWGEARVIEPGVEPVPPADLRDPGFWAAAITPDDPHPNSDGKVTAHLDAFLAEGQFEGGLAFEKLLRPLRLDFSPASLAALDEVLDRLRTERQPQREALLGSVAGRNFVHLLAAYVGETLVLANSALVRWYTPRQLERMAPGRLAGATTPSTSLVAVLNGDGAARGHVLMASDIVAARLFGDADAPTLAAAAADAAGPVRAARLGRQVDPGVAWNASNAHGRLDVAAPEWFAQDPVFQRWFAALPALWRDGAVVWSNLVQANSLLFRQGDANCPGEVLYDPTGRVDPARFAGAAQAMFGLKGLRLRNPWLRFFAEALTHERVRTSGYDLPASLGARGLQTASLLFFRQHLPGGVLSGGRLPLLVSRAHPGIVMMLPAKYWPDDLGDDE